MNYQTNEQLSELRLNAMKIEYQRQSELPAVSELTFDERFSMIVTAQINARRDAKMKRLIRAADLREPDQAGKQPYHHWGDRRRQDLSDVCFRPGGMHQRTYCPDIPRFSFVDRP